MKKLLLFLLTAALSYSGFAQGDAAVGAPYLTDAGGNPVNPNALVTGQTYTLNLNIFNMYTNPIPAGATTLAIGLGQNLQFVTGVPVATTGAGLFSWTIATDPVTGPTARGSQTAAVPGLFDGLVQFQVQVVGSTPAAGSNIIVNWGINTGTGYVDIGTLNNDAALTYRTTTVLPVHFVDINAVNNNCTVNVTWKVAQEVNVSHYEVLVSNNGASFRSVARSQQSQANGGAYATSFAIPQDLKGQVLFIYVKEVDNDGKFTLSNVKTLRGNCESTSRPLVVYAYPNPVTSTSFINVAAREGVFNGKYRLELIDNNGKLYQVREVTLSNAVSTPFEFNQALSPGRYIIRVSQDGTQVGTVQFIKVGGVL